MPCVIKVIVVTHSVSGLDGWLRADERPGLVVAIVAIEPMRPSFGTTPGIGTFDWGLTAAPVVFSRPAVTYFQPSGQPDDRQPIIPATTSATSQPILSALASGTPPNDHRAVRDTPGVVGGKWKLVILTTLLARRRRFKELAREIGISPRILSKELQEPAMNKLVSRTVCDTRPITVE